MPKVLLLRAWRPAGDAVLSRRQDVRRARVREGAPGAVRRGARRRRGGGRALRARRLLRAAGQPVQAVLLLRRRQQDLPVVPRAAAVQRPGVRARGAVRVPGLSAAAPHEDIACARGRALPTQGWETLTTYLITVFIPRL